MAIALALVVARRFATTSWPLSRGDRELLVAAGMLVLLAQARKAFGWARLFRSDERPSALALATGNGGAALIGLVLPGRFDDAMRIAVVRRYPGCPAGVRALALSLVMLGVVDNAALAPLDLGRRGTPRHRQRSPDRSRRGDRRRRRRRSGARCPATSVDERACSALSTRALAEPPHDILAVRRKRALVSACWLVRAVACFVLLGTLGIGYSISLALLFLCAGAAAAALPIGPAGTAAQVGGGTAALIASRSGASQALAVAVSVAGLGVLSGAAIVLFAIAWRVRLSLNLTRSVGRSASS